MCPYSKIHTTTRRHDTTHAHRSHREGPVSCTNSPGGHCEQATELQKPEIEPASQSEHAVEPTKLQLPGPHGEHSDDPTADAKDPGKHSPLNNRRPAAPACGVTKLTPEKD